MLVAELEEKREEKERVVNGCFPPLKLSGMSVQELQVLKAIPSLFNTAPGRHVTISLLCRTCVQTCTRR